MEEGYVYVDEEIGKIFDRLKEKDTNKALRFLDDFVEMHQEIDASVPIIYENPYFSIKVERMRPFSATVIIPLIPVDTIASFIDIFEKREKYRRALFDKIKDNYL